MSNEGAENTKNTEETKLAKQHVPPTNDDEDDGLDGDAYIEKLKKEAVKWRAKAKENKEAAAKFAEADARLKEAEANASEARKEVVEVRNLADKRIINAELRALATEFGLKKPDYLKLADISKLKVSDDGEVIGARELVQELKNSDPDLFNMATTTNVNFKSPTKSDVKLEKPALKYSKEELAKKERDLLRGVR